MTKPTHQERTELADERSDLPSFPFSRAFPLDPPPEYAQLRAERPVTKARLWDGSTAWIVTRYDDVRDVLSDDRFSNVPSQPGYPKLTPTRDAMLLKEEQTFVRMDPPEHGIFRRMLTKEFMVGRMNALRPDIQRMVDALIDQMIATGRPADLVEALAIPLPSLVISEMLGVPYENHAFFEERSKARLALDVDPEIPVAAGRDVMNYLDELFTKREEDPGAGDDIISRLVIDQIRPGHLQHDEAVRMVELLLRAGHETTSNLIGMGLLSLFEHPEQLALLRADPSLMSGAVEEMLRYTSVVHYIGARAATADVEVGGQTIAAGEGVYALISAANRDGGAFPEPDAFDIRREARHHVAFGYGVHQCLGQTLARAELEIVFATLMRRLPELRLAVPFEDVGYKHNFFVYGVVGLPVTW